MCIRTINIDQARLSHIYPSFKDVNVIDRWLQVLVNDAIEDMELSHAPSPNVHTAEEMHALLVERVRRAEAGEEKTVSNQVVFDSILNNLARPLVACLSKNIKHQPSAS